MVVMLYAVPTIKIAGICGYNYEKVVSVMLIFKVPVSNNFFLVNTIIDDEPIFVQSQY